MIDKYLQIDGKDIESQFLKAPIGCPVIDILNHYGISKKDIKEKNFTILEGGPGWCFEVDVDTFPVKKNTNCLLLFDRETVSQNKKGSHVDIRNEYNWKDREEYHPEVLETDHVNIPLITNPDYEGIVYSSNPIVENGDELKKNDIIARPSKKSFSTPEHASISGKITEITNTQISITD